MADLRQEREIRRKEAFGEAIAMIPPLEREAWKNLPRGQKQRVYVLLAYLGATTQDAAHFLGLSTSAITMWFSREREHMAQLMKDAFNVQALLEMPKGLATLRELRDLSENEETRRKAALNLLAAATLGVEAMNSPAQTSQLNVHMSGQQNQFNVLSSRELSQKIDELGKKLGPDALKLIDQERHGERARGTGSPPPGGAAPEDPGPS